MLSMLCLVVVFGIHSLADWTWYVPGQRLRGAAVRRLAGGPRAPSRSASAAVRAGAPDAPSEPADAAGGAQRRCGTRGASTLRSGLRPVRSRPSPGRRAAIVVARCWRAWAQWQPQRSADASTGSSRVLARDPSAARAAAQAAVSRDPLSAQALFTLSAVQQATGKPALARATLQRAVRLQPSNPQTWLALGAVRPRRATRRRRRVHELGAAIYLNPESIAPEAIAEGNPEAIAIQNDYVAGAARGRHCRASRSALRSARARRAGQQRAARRASPPAPRTSMSLEAEVLEQPRRACGACRSAGDRRAGRSARRSAAATAPARAAQRVRARACSAAGCRPSAARGAPPRASPRYRRRARSSRPPTRRRSSRPPAATRLRGRHEPQVEPGWRARARRSGSSATSTPTTSKPARASSAASCPSPQPTSSTRSGRRPCSARPPRHASSRNARAQREVGRLEPLGHGLPQALVVAARGHLPGRLERAQTLRSADRASNPSDAAQSLRKVTMLPMRAR